jgi:hypothetical protein
MFVSIRNDAVPHLRGTAPYTSFSRAKRRPEVKGAQHFFDLFAAHFHDQPVQLIGSDPAVIE